MDSATWGLVIAVFLASLVEMVEALTIVLAMGLTRGWRSTIAGIMAAAVALALFTLAAGQALSSWVPEAGLKIVVGPLLLIFGLQWLRKAVLRTAGRKALHDEAAIFTREVGAARNLDAARTFDWFGFTVTFKGV